MLDGFGPDEAAERRFASGLWYELQDQILHEEILERSVRLDGRRFDQIRPITCEVGVLPRTHGSALFTRGETQALVTVTLGTSAAQKLDWIEGVSLRRFMLHYNFPPFSVGEVKFLRGPGRREIGHGALAERSLFPLVPSEEQWPYTIRIVSDILESNGSSSMASICGGSLALLDAGVPQKAPVAGIAMGLVMIGDKWAVLTDIAGAEDHHGDMDFKVAGSAGITGLQMDIKIAGITPEIMQHAGARREGASGDPETMNARFRPTGPRSRSTRRGSSRSRSTRRKSATSSVRAARRSGRSSSGPVARSKSTTTDASTSPRPPRSPRKKPSRSSRSSRRRRSWAEPTSARWFAW